MDKLKLKIDKFIEIALISLMSAMVLTILWQVITRYLFNSPSEYTDELSRYLLIWMGLLGAAYVTGQKAHIALDFFAKKFFGNNKKLEISIQLLILVFTTVIFLVGGGMLVYITLSLGQISSALNLPLGYVYLIVPVSGILIIFYTIFFIREAKKS
ncbi:MAG: TRAP transporter small permease [Bacteroidota bacterium]